MRGGNVDNVHIGVFDQFPVRAVRGTLAIGLLRSYDLLDEFFRRS